MNVYEQLNEGMRVLIQHENEFKGMLLSEIIFLVDNFEPCTYNAEPEVADSLHLSLEELKDLIAKIKDDSVINADAVRGIEQQVHDVAREHDLRRPKQASFLTRMGLTSPTVATPVAPAAPIAVAAPVAPKRTWMGAMNDMLRPPTNLPEATPVERQVYQPGPGGRRKTRRKV